MDVSKKYRKGVGARRSSKLDARNTWTFEALCSEREGRPGEVRWVVSELQGEERWASALSTQHSMHGVARHHHSAAPHNRNQSDCSSGKVSAGTAEVVRWRLERARAM